MNANEWSDFRARAQRDGQLIEKVIKDVYVSNLPPRANALDGGANVGYHTIGLAEHLTHGRVLAVEANRATFSTLKQKVGGYPHVTPIFGALQNDPALTHISFNCSTSHPGRSGLGRMWDLITPGQVSYAEPDLVPATTIDRLVLDHGLSSLDFIKLDLEGGEYNALRGAESSMRTYKPLIVTEHAVHAQELNHFVIGDHFAWLSALGYTPVSPTGDTVDMRNPFPFWYVFLVPTVALAHWQPRISAAIRRFM